MRIATAILLAIPVVVPGLAQRPPIVPLPEPGPQLDYSAVATPFALPTDFILGAASSVAVDANGHVYIFNRGEQPLVEFDAEGRFIRALGEGLFVRPHGLRIDRDGNLWLTDVNGHTVTKLSPEGNVLLTLGVRGEPGEWNEASGSRLLNEPNDVAIGVNGDIFVVQGHGRAEPGVLKFDRDGRFILSWGGSGTGPGQFDVAHSVAIHPSGQVHVADRENHRIQIFDTDGNYLREMTYSSLPCGLQFTEDALYLASGFTGQVLKLDLEGTVLEAIGMTGTGLGQFGEAHYVAVGPSREIYVADPVNGRVEKFVPN